MPKSHLKSLNPFSRSGEKESVSTECTMAMDDENLFGSEEFEIPSPPPDDDDDDDPDDDPDDTKEQEDVYGYGEASPDIAVRTARKRYSATRSSTTGRSSTNRRGSTASGDSQMSRDSCYSCPDSALGQSSSSRRSSMKQAGRSRRASIQFSGEIEVSLPGRDNPVRRRTSISFNETVKVKRVARVHELTEEPEELWFQDDEYDKIRRKSFKIVDKFVNGEKIQGKKLCTRGLESILNHESRSHAKVDAWESVLNEQHMQREDGNYDDEYISQVYKFSTRRSSNEAKQRANQDEKEVERYLQSTRRICRRLTIA